MDYGKELTSLTAEVMAIMIWEALGVGIFGQCSGAAPSEAEMKAEEKRRRKNSIRIR